MPGRPGALAAPGGKTRASEQAVFDLLHAIAEPAAFKERLEDLVKVREQAETLARENADALALLTEQRAEVDAAIVKAQQLRSANVLTGQELDAREAVLDQRSVELDQRSQLVREQEEGLAQRLEEAAEQEAKSTDAIAAAEALIAENTRLSREINERLEILRQAGAKVAG